jgi:RimK family alpha-L-glutamate ligase
MRNKAESIHHLQKAGLPVPKTIITESIEEAVNFVKTNYPCVLKPITGFGGLGVQLIDRDFDLENIFDFLKHHSRMFGKGAFLLQEYIRNPGFDIRAFILDNQIIGTMQRVATDGIVTNIHSGGIARENDIDVADLATRAASSVNGKVVGVDIIPDEEGKLWILEVNSTPGWTGLQSVTDENLTDRIADWLVNH